MAAQHSAEWQALTEALHKVESSPQTREGAREAWEAWRAALKAWRKTVAEDLGAVEASRSARDERRRH